MSSLLPELKHSLRLLRRQPGFSLLAIVTLGAGIGAATAVFALVHAVLLKDLPFADPDRLVWMYNARTERDRAPLSIPDLRDYLSDASTLSGLATFTNWTANLTGAGEAERLEGTRVSGNFFPVLGAAPLLGRTLSPSDESADARVAVLTNGLWNRRFGGDPGIVGRPVLLNGVAYTVVGVLPPEFVFPFRDAQVAVPLTLREDPRRIDRGANFLRVVARLKPGVTLAQAKADLDTIAHRLQRAYPDDDARKTGVSLYPLHSEIVRDYGQILWTLLAAVAVLVAISCGNLANLLLVRASGRRAELGLRASLGASRGRIAGQLAIEAMVLCGLGGIIGLAMARWAITAWQAFGPADFPRMAIVGIDERVVMCGGIVSVMAAVLCGPLPAWAATRDVGRALGDATRSVTSSGRHARVRRAFVVLQVAGCALLLVCMGLVAKGFARLVRVEPGFTRDHALSVQLSLPPDRYATRDRVVVFYDALHARLSSIPGSQAVGAVSLLPLSGLLNTMDVVFPDRPAPPPTEVPQAHFRIASDGYFAAAGIRLIEGREFSVHDTDGGRPVAIVSRTFADRHWPNEQAVGKHLRLGVSGPSASLEVVGVVHDVKQFTVDGPSTADLYVPLRQMPAGQAPSVAARMNWVIRTADNPRRLDTVVRQAVHQIDPDIATSSIRTFEALLSAALAGRRANVRLLEVFGQVAVVIAAVGVYAIAAFSAGTRRRELAIRAAFGANGRELAQLVLRGELPSVVLGIGVGLTVAAAVAGRLVGALFEVSPWDPITYLLVAGGLLLVAGTATFIPARHAGSADPAELLRT